MLIRRDLLSLLFFIITINFLSSESNKNIVKKSIILGLLMSALFYSRGEINLNYSTLLILSYLYRVHSLKPAIIFLSTFLITSMPWIILRFEMTGFIFPVFSQSRYFPEGDAVILDKTSSILNRFLFFLRSTHLAFTFSGVSKLWLFLYYFSNVVSRIVHLS